MKRRDFIRNALAACGVAAVAPSSLSHYKPAKPAPVEPIDPEPEPDSDGGQMNLYIMGENGFEKVY